LNAGSPVRLTIWASRIHINVCWVTKLTFLVLYNNKSCPFGLYPNGVKQQLTPVNNKNGKAQTGQRNKQSAKSMVRTVVRQPAREVVYAPVAKATISRTLKPAVRTMPNGNVRITHTEYVSEVFGSVNYNTTGFIVQPGLSSSFPWLSLMAPLYETYTFNSLSFKYVTQRATTTEGSVNLALDYDVQDTAPRSKVAIRSMQGCVRSAPWADCVYHSTVADLQKIKTRYIRTAVVASADAKTFDVGTFFVGTQGCASTAVLGELSVTYDITFQTPQLDLSAFASSGSNLSVSGGAVTATLLLGPTPALNQPGSGLIIQYNTTTGVITPGSVGSFLFVYSLAAANVTGTVAFTATGGSSVISAGQNGTTGGITFIWTAQILNATDTITITGLTITTPAGANLRIASYPFGL
jgi:hypothetical protein